MLSNNLEIGVLDISIFVNLMIGRGINCILLNMSSLINIFISSSDHINQIQSKNVIIAWVLGIVYSQKNQNVT